MPTATQTTANYPVKGESQVPSGKVRSKDGTLIAFTKTGQGAPLMLVDGAMCYRSFGPSPQLVPLLVPHFTVYSYDRRGRGESGDTRPYAVAREIEDLEALINEAGGSAYMCGISSGGALALEAANHGLSIPKLAIYEAPFIVDDSRAPIPQNFLERLKALIASDRRGEAVELFMKLVGVPAIFIAIMRFTPAWSKLKAIAHTLPYDITIVQDHQRGEPLPAKRWDSATTPTAVFEGGKSPAWMRHAMQALAQVLPNAQLRTLEGQTHMVKAKVLAPALTEFFAG